MTYNCTPKISYMNQTNKTNESTYTSTLKNEIEATFGKKITSSKDCLLLSEDLFIKISVKVNSNTLRRFFGVVKTNYFPSPTIIEILCHYCGFSSFEEFTALKITPDLTNKRAAYSVSVLNYLINIFKNIHTAKTDKTFSAIVKHTIQLLQRHPELYDKFHRAIAKTKNGQQFYYEQFIHIDGLNSFYGTGLRYYLLENSNPEAQVFGHTLLCVKNWLSDDSVGLKKHYDQLSNYYITKEIHPGVSAHLFAAQLLYANIYGLPIHKIVTNAKQTHALIIACATKEQSGLSQFENLLFPVLLLTGHANEALYYINYLINNYPDNYFEAPGTYQSTQILKALAFVKTGKLKEAETLYQQIHPSQFNFLTKKTDMIMYLFLKQYLKKEKGESQEQLQQLIKETGFTRLNLLKSENPSIESLQFFSINNAGINT